MLARKTRIRALRSPLLEVTEFVPTFGVAKGGNSKGCIRPSYDRMAAPPRCLNFVNGLQQLST